MSYRTSAMRRPNTSAPGDGSRTMTITSAPPNEDDGSATDSGDSTPGTLRLRASTRKPRQRVVWREDVVDNEGTGKKSSKICCIYHKPKAFDESSDEEDSDSDSDSECEQRHAAHRHVHGGHGEQHQDRDAGAIVEHIEHAEPNAYEKGPSSKKPKHTAD